jgi:hypothetical protein
VSRNKNLAAGPVQIPSPTQNQRCVAVVEIEWTQEVVCEIRAQFSVGDGIDQGMVLKPIDYIFRVVNDPVFAHKRDGVLNLVHWNVRDGADVVHFG